MTKSKKNKNKPKLNLTVREEQRNKLEQMASLENRSISNLIEVMADERWKRLAEQQGVASAAGRGQPLNLLEAVRQVGNEAFQNVYKLAREREALRQKGVEPPPLQENQQEADL
jgi:uncharacterized protein (DUF1778 family)